MGYRELQEVTMGYTGCTRKLQWVTRDNRRLQGITGGYKGLQGVKF